MQKTCPSCDYTWETRKEKPKLCPYCGFRLWTMKDVQENTERMKKEGDNK